MKRSWLAVIVGLGLVLGLGAKLAAQEAPAERRAEERTANLELGNPRALLQITSEAGVCYWRIAGDDDLVRLPVEDERFATVLLSARFADDQLHLSIAGERAPLDTTSLGEVELGITGGSPVRVDSFRALKSRGSRGWQLQALPPNTKVDTSNCCSCGLTNLFAKLSCCPNKAYCIGCGACGTCCG